MYSGYIGIMGMIHNFQFIADIVSIKTKKAESFQTLPFNVDIVWRQTYPFLTLGQSYQAASTSAWLFSRAGFKVNKW